MSRDTNVVEPKLTLAQKMALAEQFEQNAERAGVEAAQARASAAQHGENFAKLAAQGARVVDKEFKELQEITENRKSAAARNNVQPGATKPNNVKNQHQKCIIS